MQNDYVVTPASRGHAHLQQWHLDRQVVVLFLTILVAWIFIVTRVTEALWQTLFLYLFVSVAGLWLITRLAQQLRDAHVQILGYVYLLKLMAVLFVLYGGWVPMLDPASASFGYDPQRYYFDAATVAQSNFNIAAVPSLNYTGVLLYFGVVFAVFGHNPISPALVNTFVTLLATLLLVKVGYQLKRERGRHDWLLGLAMVIPEVLWFDVMTARETLVMSLITISTLTVIGYLIKRTGDRFPLWLATMTLPAMLLLAIVRTTVLIPIVVALVLFIAFWIYAENQNVVDKARVSMLLAPYMALLRKSRVSFKLTARRLLGLALLGTVSVIFLLAPGLSQSLGFYSFDYGTALDFSTTRNDTFLNQYTWTERSFGQLLIPNNSVQAVAYSPIRLLFYLVAPFPTISLNSTGLLDGNWEDWQQLLTLLSVFLYIALFPRAIAALVYALREKQARIALAFHIPFWITMFAIAGGNLIIHERYRIMAVLLLWGCIWLGQTCPKRLVRFAYYGWLGLLILGGVVYVMYKFIL